MTSFYVINMFLLWFMMFTYLISFAYFVQYLRRAYTNIWMQLGAPRFDSSWARDNPFEFFRSFLNVLQFAFSDGYTSFNDRQLSNLVWLVRGSLIFGISLFTVEIVVGLSLNH